jgi:phthalate 4,5-dioxygenase oxygenase subunit
MRCAFHGWLFDVEGNCLETPAEPEASKLCSRIKQRAYPVVEKAGMVFAYLGEGEPPAFPDFDCFVAPASHTFAFKGLFECNWLQALEVGIDPAHASYLHRFFEDEDTSEGVLRQAVPRRLRRLRTADDQGAARIRPPRHQAWSPPTTACA